MIILLAVGFLVIAGNGAYNFYFEYDPYSFFGLSPLKKFNITVTNDGSIPEDKLVAIEVEKPVKKLEPVIIEITEKGFVPSSVEVEVGQPIVWKNKHAFFKSMIAGVREAEELRSKLLEPKDYFTWNFSKAGEYDYVDAVIIGRTGKIIVTE